MKPPDALALSELADMERRLVYGLAEGLYPERPITEDDLTDVPARAWFRAVDALRRQGVDLRAAIPSIAVREQMVRDGATEHWIAVELVTPVTPSEFHASVRRVLQESLVRRASQHLRQALSLVENQGRDLAPEELEEKVTALISRPFCGTGRDVPTTDDEALIALRDALEAGRQREGVVASANQDQDLLTGGTVPGQLVILAAPTGLGKSAYMLQWATHVIRTQGPVMLLSLEMTADEIALRMAQQLCRVQKEELTPAHVERARLIQRQGPLYIFDSGKNIQLLAARISHLQMRHPDLKAVFVDYLGLVRDRSFGAGKTYHEVSNVVRDLKDLAQQYRLPIIALHQVSRSREGRADKRPTLSDLRDSGVIEEAANQVLFLYRKAYDGGGDDKNDPGPAELIVAKNRGGRTGTVALHWEPSVVSYYPVTRRHQEPPPATPPATPPQGWYERHESRQDLFEEVPL